MSLLSRLAVQAARAYGILSAADKNKVVTDYLVVAGGGAGGSGYDSGGGGAGGLLTSTATLSTLNTYSITVGAGGATVAGLTGANGSNSVISGTGITTVTSIGGGGGGGDNGGSAVGSNGGSGGGGGYINSPVGPGAAGGTGTAGQGNNGGSGYLNVGFAQGGGGGGASAVGGNATTTAAGGGGNGTASSISGSSVTYAGGGGGGGDFRGSTAGAGGAGGGGAGTLTNGVAGTANLGGGGGGGGYSGGAVTGGTGGSGVVIISYTSATPLFTGGTVTTSGGKQIHTFTSSGTLSPITPITASYLVVAGGGGGGTGASGGGGGGGAGGLLTNSTTLYSGATYVVTVGAGGTQGVNGSNSVVSGTGLTTLTAIGGGYGGSASFQAGNSGGSGGGGAEGNNSSDAGVGGAGTSGQGYAGGKGAGATGGGGGGAGAVGSAAQSPTYVIGNGGIGVQSSISGTATYYAGGGGGSGYGPYTGSTTGVGGQGGGGTGASGQNGSLASAGTPNTGGGGGAKNTAGTGSASGGSGIVIISYAGSQVFNGGLVTSSGGNTIHTFTSTGALTPLTNNLNNSLRFRSSASATLSRTPTSSTNRRTWTWSNWIKRGNLGIMRLCGAASSSTNETSIYFDSNNKLAFVSYIGSENARLITTQVFRDPSAWYHIVVTVDTTQATAANRIKMYVNGNQVTAFDTATYPSQNYETIVNSTTAHYYGTFDTSYYYDGYVTDAILIDGQALEPYYFGNNDANGVWKPIQYRGTYGTNGFYLTFGNTTSTTTLGYDSSPNGNNWTCNNISLTAGTTYDAMTDVPTNTSATVANYATLNPNLRQTGTGQAPTSANLKLTANTTGYSQVCCATIASPSGKFYWEVTVNGGVGTIGIADSNNSAFTSVVCSTSATTSDPNEYTWGWSVNLGSGNKKHNNVSTSYGSAASSGDVYMCAVDIDNSKVWWGKNGTWFASGSPTAGTNAAYTNVSGNIIPYLSPTDGSGYTNDINFGQRPFNYSAPSGFLPLNTYNLPTPTILQGNKYMDATLYTGTGTALNVVNAGQFKPDFVWAKNRSAADSSGLYDSVRGVNQRLISNLTNAEDTSSGVSAFNSNGFSLGTAANYNTSGNNFVGWSWQAGQGTTSSNTSGSITSTVSVNTTAGFSVVKFTSQASGTGTVGHGLGVAPKFIITKLITDTSGANWNVYHASIGNTGIVNLNTTGATTTNSQYWNNTTPTSNVFTIGTWYAGSLSTIAYCWAEIAGFSKFGSYTGNGSTNGPFVYTGFRPKFLMFKTTTIIGHWVIVDTSRNTYNVIDNSIYPDTAGSEINTITDVDFLSNGFKWRGVLANETNVNGEVYIYMAFAENPFKNSNAR